MHELVAVVVKDVHDDLRLVDSKSSYRPWMDWNCFGYGTTKFAKHFLMMSLRVELALHF